MSTTIRSGSQIYSTRSPSVRFVESPPPAQSALEVEMALEARRSARGTKPLTLYEVSIPRQQQPGLDVGAFPSNYRICRIYTFARMILPAFTSSPYPTNRSSPARQILTLAPRKVSLPGQLAPGGFPLHIRQAFPRRPERTGTSSVRLEHLGHSRTG